MRAAVQTHLLLLLIMRPILRVLPQCLPLYLRLPCPLLRLECLLPCILSCLPLRQLLRVTCIPLCPQLRIASCLLLRRLL